MCEEVHFASIALGDGVCPIGNGIRLCMVTCQWAVAWYCLGRPFRWAYGTDSQGATSYWPAIIVILKSGFAGTGILARRRLLMSARSSYCQSTMSSVLFEFCIARSWRLDGSSRLVAALASRTGSAVGPVLGVSHRARPGHVQRCARQLWSFLGFSTRQPAGA